MSYYMSNGQQVSQAAAGLGRFRGRALPAPLAPPRSRLHAMRGVSLGQSSETPAAVQGGGMTAGPASEYDCMYDYYQKVGQSSDAGSEEAGFQQYLACREAAFSLTSPQVAGGQRSPYGVADRPYRDGIFTPGPSINEFGMATRPYRDGIFGGHVGLGQVPNVKLDLSDPSALKQFKLMFQYAFSAPGQPFPLSAEALDAPYWDEETESAYVARMGGVANAVRTVSGHSVPTSNGVQVVLAGAAAGGADPSKIAGDWPAISAWAVAGANTGTLGEVVPPSFGKSKMAIFYVGGAALAAIGIGALIMKSRKRSRRR